MAIEDPNAVYVIFRRDVDKSVHAIFPLSAAGNDSNRCVTAKASGEGLQLDSSAYDGFMRKRHAAKPKEYRDLLRRIRVVFGDDICVIQQATDYMHTLRHKRLQLELQETAVG